MGEHEALAILACEAQLQFNLFLRTDYSLPEPVDVRNHFRDFAIRVQDLLLKLGLLRVVASL